MTSNAIFRQIYTFFYEVKRIRTLDVNGRWSLMAEFTIHATCQPLLVRAGRVAYLELPCVLEP